MPADNNEWVFKSKNPQTLAFAASKSKIATRFLASVGARVLTFARFTPATMILGFAAGWAITKIQDALNKDEQEVSFAQFKEVQPVAKSTLPTSANGAAGGFQADYLIAEKNKFNVLEALRDDVVKSLTLVTNAVLSASNNNAATIANSNALLAAQLSNIAKILSEQFELNKDVAKQRVSQDLYNKQIDATQSDYSDLTSALQSLGTTISRSIQNGHTHSSTTVKTDNKDLVSSINRLSENLSTAEIANAIKNKKDPELVAALNNLSQKGSSAGISHSIDNLAKKMDNAALVEQLSKMSVISKSIDSLAKSQEGASETTKTMFDAQKKFYEREIASNHSLQDLRAKNLELDKQIAEFKTKEVIINNEKVSPLAAEFQKDLTDAKVNDFNLKVRDQVLDLDGNVVATKKSALEMQAYKTVAEARLKTDEANQQDLLDDKDLDYSDLLGAAGMLEIIPKPEGLYREKNFKEITKKD